MAEQQTGVLLWWSLTKNFGVVRAPNGQRYYLHVSRVLRGPAKPQADSVVTFYVSPISAKRGELPAAIDAEIFEQVEVESKAVL